MLTVLRSDTRGRLQEALLGWEIKLPSPPLEDSGNALDVDLSLGDVEGERNDLALVGINRIPVEVVEDGHRQHRRALVAIEEGMASVSECIMAAALAWMSG